MSNPSWKDHMKMALVSAGLATGVAYKATQEKPHAEIVEKKVITPADFSGEWGTHPHDKFLKTISYLESSGGANVHHRPSTAGIQAGSTAIGPVALKPNTVRDISNMFLDKNSVLVKRLGPNFKDKELQETASLPDIQMEKALKKNPNLYNRTARYLAEHLEGLHGDDEQRKAFGWRFGHNKTNISNRDLKDSGYVKKFNTIRNSLKE